MAGLSNLETASSSTLGGIKVGSNLSIDGNGVLSSTAVTLATVSNNYLSISGQSITAGTVPISLGGTGATTQSGARSNLGLGSIALLTAPSGDVVGTSGNQTITDKTFDTSNIFPTFNQNTTGSSGSCTGNAASATKLQTIDNGIVKTTNSDGTISISSSLSSTDLPSTIDSNTTGSSATCTGNAASASKVGVSIDSVATNYVTFVSDTSGNKNINVNTNLKYYQSQKMLYSKKIGYYNSGNDYMYFDFDPGSGHYISIISNITAMDTEHFRFTNSGAFHADDNITAFSTTVGSDRRLKTNIHKIKYGLKDILKLNSVEFDWKEKRNKKT